MEIGSSTTREERLGWNPDEAIARLLRPGPDERATVALAMFDQLEAAGIPMDALDMCVMFWSRALDGCNPGPVPPDRLARLDSDLAIEIRMTPILGRWLVALRRPVTRAEDLDWVIQFLMQVHQTWAMTVQFRGRTPR